MISETEWTYTPAEIATMLEEPQEGHNIARICDAFWPTIKAALLAYDQRPVEPRVRPL